MNHLQHILNWIEHSLDCNQAERMLAVVLPVVWQPAALAPRLAMVPAQGRFDRHRDGRLSDIGYGSSYGELTGRAARKPGITQGFTAATRTVFCPAA